MASEDQNEGEKDPSDLVIVPFQWGTVLSAVKDQIPSMDSDISVSDGDEDEELFIFQRDQSNLIPDLSEELEDLPLEEAHLQKTFAFMRHPTEAQHEDQGSPASQKDRSVSQSVSVGHMLLGSDCFGFLAEERPSQQLVAASEFPTNEQKPGNDVKKDKDTLRSLSDTLPSVEMAPFLILNGSIKDRKKLIETKILTKATLGPPLGDVGHSQPKNNNNFKRMATTERDPGAISAEHPRELTLFAFKEIEKWDLDKVLQDLEKQSNNTSWTREPALPSMYHENSRAMSQAKLMGKLEELSLKQSRAFFAHRKRCLAKLPHLSECQGDGRDIPILAPLTTGQSPSPVELQWAPEPPTVYIDLRDTFSQKPEADAEESLSNSSTDEEEDIDMTDEKKVGDKMNEFRQPSRKDCTGKSFLLQQLRNFRRTASQSAADRGRSQDLQSSEDTDLLNVRGRCNLKWRGVTSVGPADPKSDTKNVSLEGINSVARPSRELKEETKEGTCSELIQDSSAESSAGYPRTEESQKEKWRKEKPKKGRFQEIMKN